VPLQKIGWYHSHPNISIFLSHWDLNVCKDFDCRRTPIALVVDPVRNRGGFFVGGKEGYQAQCPQGFYEKCDLHPESLVTWSNMVRVDSGAAPSTEKQLQTTTSPSPPTALRISPPSPPRRAPRPLVVSLYVFVVAALSFLCVSQWVILGRQKNAAPAGSGAMSLAPSYINLSASQRQEFKASVPGTDDLQVAWSLAPPDLGTITHDGMYTAPQSVASGETVTITATSKADPTKSASFVVTLTPSTSASSVIASAQNQSSKPTPVNSSSSEATPPKKTSSAPSTSAKANTGPAKNDGKADANSKSAHVQPSPDKKKDVQTDSKKAGKSPAPSDAAPPNPAAAGGNQPVPSNSGASQTTTGSSAGAAAKDAGGNGPAAPVPSTPDQIAKLSNAPQLSNSPSTDTAAASRTAVPVSIEPQRAVLNADDKPKQFTVNGISGEVLWSLDPQVGTITSSGLYTPPTRIEESTTVTIKALGKDSGGSAEVTVKLLKSEKSPN
jgi:hypothetical protein